jgi:hypothetical protein
MSYNIKNSSGNSVVVLPDRHIDKDSTSLSLVGFNATDYGLDYAENFVHLLENFANDVEPQNPITGQLWFNTSSNTLNAYHSGQWTSVSSTPSVVSDPEQGGIAGMFHCPIRGTSVALVFAGGEIVAAVSGTDIDNTDLPDTVDISGLTYSIKGRFASGIKGGITLADTDMDNNSSDLIFSGRIPLSEQAHFAGGGATDAEISGWGYIDIGANKSLGLMISGGQIVSAISAYPIANADLPTSVSFFVKREISTDVSGETTSDGNQYKVTCLLRSRFPAKIYREWGTDSNGLPIVTNTTPGIGIFPGLTFSIGAGINDGISQQINSLSVQQNSVMNAAILEATNDVKNWVEYNSNLATSVAGISSEFTSATGTHTLPEAIQSILAMTTDTGAVASAISNLKSDFASGLGVSDFAAGLTKINTASSNAATSKTGVEEIENTFMSRFGGSSFSESITNLYYQSSNGSSTSQYNFASVPEILSSPKPSQGSGTLWIAGNYGYIEADSTASDQHITTAGGVKLYVIPVDGYYPVEAFGELGMVIVL